MASYPARERFALALAAPLVTAMQADPGELAGYAEGMGRAGLDDFLGSRAVLELEGLTSRDSLLAWTRERLVRERGDAFVLADVVYTVGLGVRTQLLAEADAWPLLFDAAHLAQQQYASWDEYADAYQRHQERPVDLEAARAVWAALPWRTIIDAASSWAELPLRQRFALALGAPHAGARDPRKLGGASGSDFATRAEVIEHVKPRLDGDAGKLSGLVGVIGAAAAAELLSDEEAWQILLVAAKRAQLAYRSWDAFGAACGGDVERAAIVWADVPWDTELGVTLVDPAPHVRVLAVTCPGCGAPRTRASPTAYIYCDACGSLVDYDFAVAIGLPIAQPGPVYEQLRTRLATELSTARAQGDTDGYRAAQRRLFDAWVDACPTACPPRVKDPAYRAGYVAWLAEAQVVADFDADAQAREASMHAAVGKLTFVAAGTKIRVPADAFRVLADAMFDYEARRDELFVERGVYALQPDGASRDIQRRIGLSMFVQAWLPMLEPAEAQALVERAGFVREYTLVPPAATRSASCSHCGGPLSVVDGAKRVVCDHCGRLVDVVGST